MQKSPFIQDNVGVRSKNRHQKYHSSRQTERTQQASLKRDPKRDPTSRSGQIEPRASSWHSKLPSPYQDQRHQTTDTLPQTSGACENSTRLKDSRVGPSEIGASRFERALDDSRQRLLRINGQTFENEPNLSLRQSNVVRSPRVYNYTSGKLQNDTLKRKDLSRTSINGRIQQVTVGPTESDSICEIYFQPGNATVERPSPELYISPERSFSKGLHEPSPWKQKSHSNNFHRKLNVPSPRESKSHFEAFRRPYFEKYSDTEVPTSTTDVTIENKRLPRHLVSTESTEIQNRRMFRPNDNKKYVSDTSKENSPSLQRLHQKPSIPTHYVSSSGRSTAITSHGLASVRDDYINSRTQSVPTHYIPPIRRSRYRSPSTTEYTSSRSQEKRHSETRTSYSKVNKVTTPSYYNQYLRNRTLLNPGPHAQGSSNARSITNYQRRRHLDSESSEYHRRASDNFDALTRYRDDTYPQLSSSHDYYINRSRKIPSSNQFESANHGLDAFDYDYDATILDADIEHYLNQKVLRKIAESNALHNVNERERHLVPSSYGSPMIETTSDESYDFPNRDQSSDQISETDVDSSSESLHVSELDSNSSDDEITSSPVKSSFKAKFKPPALMDDFKLYHRTGSVKQVHFKEPISVATTVSNITLDELGMTSESTDHDVTVVELEDDYSDHSMIPSPKHDKMSAELEKKRFQDAGNTPKIIRTKTSTSRKMLSPELENKPSLIESFEEPTLQYESRNAECKNCNYSRDENNSNLDSDSLKISKGTNTDLHLLVDAQPHGQFSLNDSFNKKDKRGGTATKSNGFPTDQTSKKSFRGPGFESRCDVDGESLNQNEKEKHPNHSSTHLSNAHQSRNGSSVPTEISAVMTPQRKSTPLEHSLVSSLGNEAGASPDDTVIINEDLSRIQGMTIRSPNPPTCSIRSRDYRMMRLQAVIDCSPPKERKNIIIKARYFCRWKDNVRLLTRIKKKDHRKLKRAESFYRITALAKHFFSWRGLILEQQIKADEFHYRCVLKRGMMALRWATLNRRIKTDRAKLGRQKVKLDSCFKKWQMRYKTRRVCRLHKLFFHWRRRLHENLIVAKLESNRRHASQHEVFEMWHERFVSSVQVRISEHHYNCVLTQKIWNTWRIYTADQLVKVSQREVAEVKFEFCLLNKIFKMWKKVTQQKLSLQNSRNRKIMSSSLQKWRHFAHIESLRHQKDLNIARLTRRENILSHHFHVWMIQLKLLNFRKNRHNTTLRYCLLMWRSQMNRHQLIHAEIAANHDLVLKKHGMAAFKQHADHEKDFRREALRELKRRILQRHFKCWHVVVARKSKLREIQDTFRTCSIKNFKQIIFTNWKNQLEVILKEQRATVQWSMTCVAKAASKWLRMLQLKKMKRLCDRTIAAKNTVMLQNSIYIWKTELRQIVRQNERVDEAEQHLRREKLKKYLRRWHLKSCESALIRPFVNALREKRLSRHFDSWLLYVRRKHLTQGNRDKINRQTAKVCFTEWKRRARYIESFKIAEREYHRLLMSRGLKAWIRFSKRWHDCAELTNQRKQMVLLHYFSTWGIKTKFRQVEEIAKQHDDAVKRDNAQKLLTRWKEEATKRKENMNLLICRKAEKRALSLKRVTFDTWRTAFENIQTAKNLASKIANRRMKESIQEWHNIAEASMQAQLGDFTLSMTSQQKENFKSKEVHRDWTGRSDITETDSMNGNQYSDQESNDCFEAKFETISLNELANGVHSGTNGIQITPLGFSQDAVHPHNASNSAFHELRHLKMNKQTNCCGDSGILSKDVTMATQSENDDSSISGSKEASFSSPKQDMPSNNTLTVEDLWEITKSEDSNIGSSMMKGTNGDATLVVQDSPESVSSLSSGCSDDPTLSSSTISQPQSDDPFLHPVLSDLSHLATLPINRTYKWMHKVEESKDSLKSVNHDTECMAHAGVEQKNPMLIISENSSRKGDDNTKSMTHDNLNMAQGQPKQDLSTEATYATNHATDKENFLTTSALSSPMNRSESLTGHSPAYFTPKCTPTRYTSLQLMAEMKHPVVPESTTSNTEKNPKLYCDSRELGNVESLKATSNTENGPFSPESSASTSNTKKNPLSTTNYYDSAEFGNVESSVLLALSHPATHISDLSSPLYFTPNCTPSHYESHQSPYPSGIPLLSPLQNFDNKQDLDIVTEQMEKNFSQSNYTKHEFVLQSDDVHNVVVHSSKYSKKRAGFFEESDDSRSSTSSDESQQSSWQRVESSLKVSCSDSDSDGGFLSVSKPMHTALRDSGVSTMEWLVHFALVRLRHRPVAFAFHQWKMLIRIKLWKREMMRRASKISTRSRLKEKFRRWKCVMSQTKIAKRHFCITIMKRYFSTIQIYTQDRAERRSLLMRASFDKNRQELATYFGRWQGKFQQKTALLEILHYWQSRVKSTSPSNHREARIQIRRNHDIVAECFYHWKIKTQQVKKVEKYHNETVMSRCFLSWKIWASSRVSQRETANDIFSNKLKKKVFQALKEYTSLLQTVMRHEVENERKFMSTLINQWHELAKNSNHQRSTFYKLSTKRIFKTKALCFNNWRCEMLKRKMAGVIYRRALTKKMLLSWKEAVDSEHYEKMSCRKVQELVDSHVKAAVLVKWLDEALMKSKVNSLKRKRLYVTIVQCWDAWAEKLALKKSHKLYENFLKRRCFHRWVSIQRWKREQNEKIRAMLRRWHAISSRSKKLTRMADQFRLKSNNIITDVTFNLWLIAREQSQKSRLYHEQKITSRLFQAWQLWNHRKQTLKRMVNNYLQYRAKERFAIAWHTWIHRYRVRLADVRGIVLHQKATAIHTLRFHWLAWRRKKLENDSSKFYRSKLLRYSAQTWLARFEKMQNADRLRQEHSKKKLRKVLLTWRRHVTLIKSERTIVAELNQSRWEIITMTTFVTWLKAYKNNKLSESCYERILKRRGFASFASWKGKRKSLQHSYDHTVHIVDVTMLSSCLSQWKSLYRKSRMMQVSCDQMLELKKMTLQQKSWQAWFRAKEKRDIKKLHLHNLVLDAAKKWRTYAINRVNKRRIKEERIVMAERFKHKWLCKIYFSYWDVEHKGNQLKDIFQTRLSQRFLNIWTKRTAMSICAASVSQHRILYSSWRVWRLEFVKSKAVEEASRERNQDLMKLAFKIWRSLVVQTKREVEGYKPVQSPRRNSTPRKSKIPILRK